MAAPRKTPTLAAFKTFSKDIAPAARAVLMARVHAEMERERVATYAVPLFTSFPFVYGPMGERCGLTGKVTDMKHLYLVGDEAMLKDFYVELDAAHRAHGFTGPEGHCPALIAESLVMTVEGELLKLAAPFFGIELGSLYGESRAKFLELTIGAALKAESEA